MNLRIVLDMNLSPVWVDFFAAYSINAQHWSQLGNPRDIDEKILAKAIELDACILTQDLDFGTLHALHQTARPSVIQIRSPLNLPEQIGALVIDILQSNETRLQSGALITIEPPQFRIRDLPIV